MKIRKLTFLRDCAGAIAMGQGGDLGRAGFALSDYYGNAPQHGIDVSRAGLLTVPHTVETSQPSRAGYVRVTTGSGNSTVQVFDVRGGLNPPYPYNKTFSLAADADEIQIGVPEVDLNNLTNVAGVHKAHAATRELGVFVPDCGGSIVHSYVIDVYVLCDDEVSFASAGSLGNKLCKIAQNGKGTNLGTSNNMISLSYETFSAAEVAVSVKDSSWVAFVEGLSAGVKILEAKL